MLNRRDAMLRLGQVGAGALTLPALLGASPGPSRPAPARSCIYLFLWGGPPQQDLWDPKPDAPVGIRSQFGTARTSVPGIHFCDQMPLLARQADKLAVVRSLSHPSDNHEPSVYRMMTGHTNLSLVVPRNARRRGDFPCVGSVVSALSPAGGSMPATVTVPRPIGHDGVTYAGTYAGFLGPRHDPMEPLPAPNPGAVAAHPLSLAPDLSAARVQARRGLLATLEREDRRLQRAATADGPRGFYEQAFGLLASPAARRAFDVESEPPTMRDRYGRNEYGESLLLARRLVEAGVRLVTVTWMYIFPNGRVSNVWDNHAGYGIHGARTGYDLLRSPVCIPPLDRGLSALLGDLEDRGLLGETLVAVAGEFGRTPKINGDGGRDHWGKCQSALFAGGGVRGGQVYGASDGHAAYVRDRPVSPEDFLATILHGLGIDPASEVHDRTGRPYRACEGMPLTALF